MIISEIKPKISKPIISAATDYYKSGAEKYQYPLPKFEKRLEELGWKELAVGSRSTVYGNEHKSYVLKINNGEDNEYAGYVNLIKRNPNKHFPKISAVRKFLIGRKTYYVYLIEKLYPIPDRLSMRYTEWLDWYLCNDVTDRAEIFHNRLPKIFTPEMIKACNTLIRYSNKHRVIFDIHENNIMYRRDGTLVITDPYVEEE